MTDQHDKILQQLKSQSNDPLGKALPVDLHWQMMLGSAANDNFGLTVKGIDDIIQSLKIICTTQKGSVPHEPNFAVDIQSYLDKPSLEAIPQIISELTLAIKRYEPRVILSGLTAYIAKYEQVMVVISWYPTESIRKELIITEVAL